MPGRNPAGSAGGGSDRTRESATASEPAVSLSAKPSGERKRKPVGGPETRVTPLPIESISATRLNRFQLQNRCACRRL